MSGYFICISILYYFHKLSSCSTLKWHSFMYILFRVLGLSRQVDASPDGKMQRSLEVFHSFTFFLKFICYIYSISVIFSSVFSTSPLCVLNAYIVLIMTISVLILFCHICLSSFSRFTSFLLLRSIGFMKLLSHQQGSVQSPWCCPANSTWLPTCVSLRGTR
jgi:hypothetical protein